jgi:hypothetical protein
VPPEDLRKAGTDYPPAIRAAYLQLPRLDSRIPRLAQEITQRAHTPFDRATAIELYLRTRFGYTLTQPDPPPADPLAYFLFRRQAGHCEYFATAMTVMVRSLGIPARYVNGFLPGEYNDVADSYIVRGSDAHSWVEVYFPRYGWIVFDPTPPAGAKPEFSFGRLAYYWDWFEMVWSEWVINYNAVQQTHLASNVQRTAREWRLWFDRFTLAQQAKATGWLKRWNAAARDSFRGQPKALLLPALVLAAFILFILRGRALAEYLAMLTVRAGLGYASSAQVAPRLATLYYTRLLRELEGRGFSKPDSQTPREFAARLADSDLSRRVMALTEAYEAARFGGHSGDPRALARCLREVEAYLR